MKIQHLSASANNINYRGTKQIAKIAIGAIATGFAAAIGKHKTQQPKDDIFYEDLSDVHEVDDNIFDEEYYQAYYNIDLNLAHNRAFRDNELFNPIRDKENFGYQRYDEDDVCYADSLIYENNINEYTTNFKLSDTDFGEKQLPNSVTKPHLDDLKILPRFTKLQKAIKELNIDKDTKDRILRASRKEYLGNNEIDYSIVDIALKLYNNSREWDLYEYEILDNIKDQSSADYKLLQKYINARLQASATNSEILSGLQKYIKVLNGLKRSSKNNRI